jgi:excisionase family DNA binding protein
MTGERSDLLTTSEAAAMLRVSRGTVARYVRLGELPAVRLPGKRSRIRIPRAAVEKLLSQAGDDLASGS